jgi:hypothetical protein
MTPGKEIPTYEPINPENRFSVEMAITRCFLEIFILVTGDTGNAEFPFLESTVVVFVFRDKIREAWDP